MPTCETEIRRVSCRDILNAPNAEELFAAYAQDCLMPGAKPQKERYQAMEDFGSLVCFGYYAGEELVGFVTTVASVMPHHGKYIASIESLFVDSRYRGLGAARQLLRVARQLVKADRCDALLYTARVGSELEALLVDEGFDRTHSVFTEWL